MTAKHIGILAHSADGAALCFTEMVREGARALGAHQHPEITLSILPMGATFAAYDAGDLAAVNAHLMRTAQRLAAAACDFFVCPDNTAHIALDAAREPYPLPGLHICDVVAATSQARWPQTRGVARHALDHDRPRLSRRVRARGAGAAIARAGRARAHRQRDLRGALPGRGHAKLRAPNTSASSSV